MQKRRIKLTRPDKWKLDKPLLEITDDEEEYKGDSVIVDSTARQIFESKVINDLSISQMQDLIAFEGYEFWYEKKYGSKVPEDDAE